MSRHHLSRHGVNSGGHSCLQSGQGSRDGGDARHRTEGYAGASGQTGDKADAVDCKPLPHHDVIQAAIPHADRLAAFGRESFIEAYRVTLPLTELDAYAAQAFSPERIREEIETGAASYFLCQGGEEEILGYAKFLRSPPPDCLVGCRGIELQRLYVAAGQRGKGLGRLLAAHGEDRVRREGSFTVWLRVWEGNQAARQIYSGWHYEECGEEIYRVGREERRVLIMKKKLADQRL